MKIDTGGLRDPFFCVLARMCENFAQTNQNREIHVKFNFKANETRLSWIDDKTLEKDDMLVLSSHLLVLFTLLRGLKENKQAELTGIHCDKRQCVFSLLFSV